LTKKMEFLKAEHELESKQFVGSITVSHTAQYQNELAAAIREISREFDGVFSKNKLDLDSWYNRKIHDIRDIDTGYYQDEKKRIGQQLQMYEGRIKEHESTNAGLIRELDDLKAQLDSKRRSYDSQLGEVRNHCQRISEENRSLQLKLKALYETNLSLYAEIAIYRKLLDCEEGHSFSTHIQEVVRPAENVHVFQEEMVSHTSSKRTNQGPVQFTEVAVDGKFVTLENLSPNKDENLGHWKVNRVLDNSREVVYTFPAKFILKAGKSVKIWARGQHSGPLHADALVFDGADSWGFGLNVTTTLYDREGQEKANYVQTTTTSQRTLEST